uniref:DUF4590 domain-containing protein n=1 Tax=Romanomermis culicivorax TaxID=13658 RepID=A0A915JIG7_ROMCU
MAARDRWSQKRDFQFSRQAGLRKHLAAVENVLRYRKVKGSVADGQCRETIDPGDLEKFLTRSNSLPILNNDDEGKFLPQLSSKARQYDDAYYEYKNLHKVLNVSNILKYDTTSLEKFRNYLNQQLRVIETNHAKIVKSATMFHGSVNLTLSTTASTTYPVLKAAKPKIRPLLQKWRWKYFQDTLLPIVKPIRTSEPTVSRISRNSSADNNKANSDLSIRIKGREMCQCYIMYVKHSKGNVDQMKMTIQQQQHSGGNMLTVFRDMIYPNEKITFGSYRRIGQMFAIVILIDDQVLLRLNTCCESRYKPGGRLGGKKMLSKMSNFTQSL